jgi:hypothetical protein
VKHNGPFFKKYQIYRKIVKELYVFTIPQSFSLFAKGLGKPLSQASPGQTLSAP